MTAALHRRLPAALVTSAAAALVLGLGAPAATAQDKPAAPSGASLSAAHRAADSAETRETLARFFARDGALSRAAADPEVGAETVPVYYLSPRFVAGEKDAAVGELQFLAGRAVASDGQKASLWTAKQGGSWQVVNIATGDDETRYAALGERKLPGGTVFHEPQIGAWYVQGGQRVLPLNADAKKAVGKQGTTLAAYQKRVHRAYGDKLPGSAYDKAGEAGGFDQKGAVTQPAAGHRHAPPAAPRAGESADPAVTTASALAGAGALAALGLSGAWLVRARRNAR
ncbi:hypothetical protein [Streptomyces physcomitrii]|uniref:Gram-positive cocci surface proteins LPxTG domain-containing protein n=1 Tax=Streptomyces physcomitrii TaxID=2724184 RepID=A0ABX1H2K1_9ACTN|nr:hypothetical protein [Streptomyces physcomitrii]NKI41266.1 hypothetical protein [Streptomyces physcomitrii]